MPWWFHMPAVMWCGWVFLLGLIVGSFLNVVAARLPYGKSIIWPGSRCFTCRRKLRFSDNLPIWGYLRLRGRCRFCGAHFSSRYLWVEVGTGVAFVLLFVVDVLSQAKGGPAFLRPWHPAPGLAFPYTGANALPPLECWAVFLAHALLVSLLIAAAVIDVGHRIIPPLITYGGTVAGIVVSTLLPWPWPSAVPLPNPAFIAGATWSIPEVLLGPIPHGVMPWPPVGPPPGWAPAGSWQLGLVSSLIGAAAGTGLVRLVKFLFEKGMGKEALGLGDADLLMMCGAFLGWQVMGVGFFAGAVAGLALRLPGLVRDFVAGRPVSNELPFGPGLAIGVIATWLAWPWLADRARPLFDATVVGAFAFIMVVGLFAAGLILRRGPAPAVDAARESTPTGRAG